MLGNKCKDFYKQYIADAAPAVLCDTALMKMRIRPEGRGVGFRDANRNNNFLLLFCSFKSPLCEWGNNFLLCKSVTGLKRVFVRFIALERYKSG